MENWSLMECEMFNWDVNVHLLIILSALRHRWPEEHVTFLYFQCVLLKLFVFSIFLFLLDRPLSAPLAHSPCVCPFITGLHCVLLLHCPSASAPCHVTVPDHDTLRWDILVLYGSDSQKGIYVSFSSEWWKPEMRARWISGAARKQHRNRLLPCRLHVACAVRKFACCGCSKWRLDICAGWVCQTSLRPCYWVYFTG